MSQRPKLFSNNVFKIVSLVRIVIDALNQCIELEYEKSREYISNIAMKVGS